MEYLYKLHTQPTHDIWLVASENKRPEKISINAKRKTTVEVLYFGSVKQVPGTVKQALPMSDTLFMASRIAMQLHCPFDIRNVLIFRESKVALN